MNHWWDETSQQKQKIYNLKCKLCQHKQKKMPQILNINHSMMIEISFSLHRNTKHSLSQLMHKVLHYCHLRFLFFGFIFSI